jgi:hypothetical protein
MKTHLYRRLTAILFFGRALICSAAATENQTADWSELRGADSQTVSALLNAALI